MTSHNFLISFFPASRRRRTAAITFVAAAALALSGCNSGGTTGGSNTTSTSASESATLSVTPTPTPTAIYKPADASGRAQNVPVPVLPEVAKTETKEGLEAFARYWYSTLSYAYETGDMKPLEAISAPSCKSCASVKTEVTDWHSEGRWLAGGQLRVEGVHSDFIETSPGEYQAIVQVYQETLDYYLADGNIKGSLPRKPAVGDILVAVFDGSAWRANTVEHLVK